MLLDARRGCADSVVVLPLLWRGEVLASFDLPSAKVLLDMGDKLLQFLDVCYLSGCEDIHVVHGGHIHVVHGDHIGL